MHKKKNTDSSSDEKHRRKNNFHQEYSEGKKHVTQSIDHQRMAGYEGAYGYPKTHKADKPYYFDKGKTPGTVYYQNTKKHKKDYYGNAYYDESSSNSDYYKRSKYHDLSYTKSYKNYNVDRYRNGRYEDVSHSGFPVYQGYEAYNYQAPYRGQQQRYIGGVNPSYNLDVNGIRRDIEASYNVLPPRVRYDPPVGYNPSNVSAIYPQAPIRQDYIGRPITTADVRITSNENYINSSAAPLYDYREYESINRPNYSHFSTRWQPSSQSIVFNDSNTYDDFARRSRYEAGYDRYYAAGRQAYDSELDYMERKYRVGRPAPPLREGVLRNSYAYTGQRLGYGPEYHYY